MLGLDQTQRRTQNLALGQQQALALLAMNSIELREHIQREIEANPFLDAEPTEDMDVSRFAGAPSGSPPDIDTIAEAKTLEQHFIQQLPFLRLSARDTMTAQAFIGLLDDHGLVRESDAEIAHISGQTAASVAEIRNRLQRLDPYGCFSRTPFDAMLCQAVLAGEADDALQAVVTALNAEPDGSLDAAAGRAGLSEAEFARYLAQLKRFQPFPLSNFDLTPSMLELPDVIVHPGRNGAWRVDLNPMMFPRVRLNTELYRRMDAKLGVEQDRVYLRATFGRARALSNGVERRGQTLRRVSEVIVTHQSDCLRIGFKALRPLTLRDISERLSLHISTISRATSQKTIATPVGTFLLKSLLTPPVSGSGDMALSGSAVRDQIAQMIKAEDPGRPHSDEAIAHKLAEAGIDVARRTVAKYRKALGLGSTRERRLRRMAPV